MRSFADGLLIHVNLAEHLVLDLQQVVGIEEIAVLKQGVRDRLGLWIESGRAGVEFGAFADDRAARRC